VSGGSSPCSASTRPTRNSISRPTGRVGCELQPTAFRVAGHGAGLLDRPDRRSDRRPVDDVDPARLVPGRAPLRRHPARPRHRPPRDSQRQSEDRFVTDLLRAPLDELLAEAAAVRDDHHGTRVTWSPKVFIPLTMLCRDKCGYCTFAQPPARLESPYLSADHV